ncbi:MAG: hypothetical protein AAB669_01345 [Patescibacteria group bacterium]
MRNVCTCETCQTPFVSQKHSTICFDCALKHFAGNTDPEEGDFNSALLLSGKMTDNEARWLQEDLKSVEQVQDDFAEEEIDMDICEICGGDSLWCHCEDQD